LYSVKRLGYIFLTNVIARKASHILTPSEYVKQDVIKTFHLDPNKVTVTYEAVDRSLSKVVLDSDEKKKILRKYGLTQPFVVYTGSVYPHKNVDVLINAIAEHNQTREVDLELALICARSVFWERQNQKIQNKGLDKWIKMLGFVEDQDISKIYSLALALVHPSKMEGFGLTGLEAMKLGLPVISSNATCLPEVYGDAALYFDPNDVSGLVFLLETIIKDKELRDELVNKGENQAKKYSWRKMAKETLKVYKDLSAS
ncbi:MAG TPA: glycosyltransferase family 1 protein, partial [Patescibacteria group bacterium]